MALPLIGTASPRAQYTGNGSQTAFAVPFEFLANTDLEVYVDGVLKTLNTDYTLTGASVTGGGTCTFTTAPAASAVVTILGALAYSRNVTRYTKFGALPANSMETDFVRLQLQVKQIQRDLSFASRIPPTEALTASQMQWPTKIARSNCYAYWDANGTLTPAAQLAAGTTLSASTIGGFLYPRTTGEVGAGVTPTAYQYEPGNVLRYGADPTGATSSTGAIQNAISSGHDLIFPAGTYKAANLTQTADNQRFFATGEVRIQKNANGPIITCAGDYVEFNGIGFRGDAASPTFTGDGLVLNGDHPRLINCGCRWISGKPVKAIGNHVQILGTCDIYQTTDATGSGYDIEIGVSGTATLYHQVEGYYSSQSTGGIHLIDTGSHAIIGGQFGKLFIDAGTSPGGVNGGAQVGCRILGNVDVELSSATFSSCVLSSSVTCTFAAGSSGHSFNESNVLASGAVLTDNSTNSIVIDGRLAAHTAYTPTWTAASVNPAIGNGTLTGYYTKRGKRVQVSIRMVVGSTTTFGTGAYFWALPFIPTTAIAAVGSASVLDSGTTLFLGSARSLTDGTARCQVYGDNVASAFGPTAPMTWANGDEIYITLDYMTA